MGGDTVGRVGCGLGDLVSCWLCEVGVGGEG